MDRRQIALAASRAASRAAAQRRHERYIKELREAGYQVILERDEAPAAFPEREE